MNNVIIFETTREGYSINQCYTTMTVKELKDKLDCFDDNTPIYYSNDGGYTYGSITEDLINEVYKAED